MSAPRLFPTSSAASPTQNPVSIHPQIPASNHPIPWRTSLERVLSSSDHRVDVFNHLPLCHRQRCLPPPPPLQRRARAAWERGMATWRCTVPIPVGGDPNPSGGDPHSDESFWCSYGLFTIDDQQQRQ
uniref:Uncharacterized protein n=1 Tax=Oryza nivara TaxID=4536 RepID=A0A0E0GRH1_ORYNI